MEIKIKMLNILSFEIKKKYVKTIDKNMTEKL